MTKLGSKFFAANRARLARELGGGLIVATAYTALQRGNDAAFGFEQEANFWYLTGIEHPDWWVIIDGTKGKTTLVRPSVNDIHELFDGSLKAADALDLSGADDVLDRDDALALLRQYARARGLVYLPGNISGSRESLGFFANPAQRELKVTLRRIFSTVSDCQKELARLRAIKLPEEIAIMRRAIDLTTTPFADVHSRLASYAHEYEIEADFTRAFRSAGASGHAYDPIVAAGSNACTLHYHANNDPLHSGQPVLIDIGARIGGYSADITRTYCLQPSRRVEQVHAAVAGAHQAIIELIRPGLAVTDYLRSVESIMSDALDALGLLDSSDDYARYFPHAISHGLGIDVHDSLGAPGELRPGMVLTVEPGVYIREESIGVRIEDDILVTEASHENLSAGLPTGL
jgi:Xaa-Pro aminopeptidase